MIRHTSRLCEDLRCNELKKDYNEKVGDFNSNNCVCFIKDLRNFAQHAGLPRPTASVSPVNHNVGLRSQIILRKESLLSWKEWKAGSKNYILTNPEIDLKVVVNQYQALIDQFYPWFYQRVEQQFSKELQELDKINGELGKIKYEMENMMNPQSNADSKIEPINTDKASDAKT